MRRRRIVAPNATHSPAMTLKNVLRRLELLACSCDTSNVTSMQFQFPKNAKLHSARLASRFVCKLHLLTHPRVEVPSRSAAQLGLEDSMAL